MAAESQATCDVRCYIFSPKALVSSKSSTLAVSFATLLNYLYPFYLIELPMKNLHCYAIDPEYQLHMSPVRLEKDM